MVFWDEVTRELAKDYPDVEVSHYHIDAIAARMVLAPESLDVIVASNLFGDILTDLSAAITGSLGLAPSANLNPPRTFPSMFEPVHGSAPDIAGQGIANPIGQIWSGALMLEHLGHADAAAAVLAAIERVIAGGGPLTRDMGGNGTTADGDPLGRARRAVTLEALRQVGVLDERILDRLDAYRRPRMVDPQGRPAAETVPRFELAPLVEMA